MDTPTLLNQIDQSQDRLLELLDRLVSFNTVSPPARNTAGLQDFITAHLKQNGFATKQQPFYDGHVDVAALENRAAWHSDPFKLTKNGDQLTGRGVSDMKGALACYLFLFELLNRCDVALPGDLKFQAVVGEELGEAGTKTLLKQGETAEFAIVGDTSNLELQGQGGVITGWITLKSPHTYHDGNRRAMVQTGGDLKAASMVEKMPIVIETLQKLERYWGITKSYPSFTPGSDTINPAYIEGGIHPAFIADECRLWITVHFYPNEQVEAIEAEVEEAVKAACLDDPWLKDCPPTFSWGGDSMLVDQGEIFPALELDEDAPAMKQLKAAHQAVHGALPQVTMSSTVTDGGWFCHYHIPAVIYGPGQLEQAHSDNESASFAQLLAYTKTIARFVLDWCGTEK